MKLISMSRLLIWILLPAACLGMFCPAKAQDTTVFPPQEVVVDTATPDTETKKGAVYFNEGTDMPPLEVRSIPDTSLNRVRSDEAYWYTNLVPEKPQVQKQNRSQSSSWMNTLFWILAIAGFVALLIWFLASGNIFLFRRTPREMSREENAEEESESIFAMDMDHAIQKAAMAKEFRMAIRLLYLRTLRDLSQRNLIQYGHEKTNSDYLFQLSGTGYYKDFFRLTRDFEYAWYGEFPVGEESFQLMQKDFNQFKERVGQ